MDLVGVIKTDYREAMKARETELVNTLRYVIAQLDNAQIAKRERLADAEVEKVLRREAKKRQESIAAYRAGNRPKLAAKEKRELAVIMRYLPEMMSRVELDKLVSQVISQLGASGPADLGRVMGEVMKRGQGRVDGKVVSEIAKQKLR